MTNTYLSDCHKMTDSKSPPKEANSEISENLANREDRTLWDMATPEKAAQSIQKFYSDPLEECLRRQSIALEAKHAENILFWDSVRQILS